jgi:adenylate cyclase
VPSAHGASRRGLIFLCGVIPVLIATGLAVFRPPFLARVDDSVYDILLRSARTKGPGQTVAIVDVDDQSLSAIGQWPWRRDISDRTGHHFRRS